MIAAQMRKTKQENAVTPIAIPARMMICIKKVSDRLKRPS